MGGIVGASVDDSSRTTTGLACAAQGALCAAAGWVSVLCRPYHAAHSAQRAYDLCPARRACMQPARPRPSSYSALTASCLLRT